MDLFHLTEELGLQPRKTSNSNGGEYHCSCPSCGGTDRFMFWLGKDRYWCRQCNTKGDSIQFCRDFLGFGFHQARIKAQKDTRSKKFKERCFESSLRIPVSSWQEKAAHFAKGAHQRLLMDKEALDLVMRRGLSLHSIEKNCLGFHPVKTFQRRSDWGLEETENQKWICLPAGILIPIYDNGMICKIKIRKSEWKPGDLYGKYYEIPGSCNLLPLFGDSTREICLLVESELDAMLVVQEAGDLCNCIALGGAQKRPHLSLREWICARRLILFALDFDESGNKEYPYWQESFSNLEPWPVPDEKSPGDYFVKGGNLRDWILAGMKAISRGD